MLKMTKNKTIFLLISIHTFVMVLILAGLIFIDKDYNELLLRDDGYYDIAKNFVHNDGSLFHKFRGPLLPFIFSVIFIFPENIHSFIRLIVTLLFSLGIIIITFKITKNYLTIKQFFWGSLIFLLNPVYIHWTFKSAPEIYICFLLGLFIYNVLKYYHTQKIKYLVFSFIFFFLGFFIKPVFLFIPVLIFLFGIFFIKSKRILIISVIFFILGFTGYKIHNKITEIKYEENVPKVKRGYEYIYKVYLIGDSFLTDYLIKTKQFRFPFINEYTIPYKADKFLDDYTKEWLQDFYEKYPDKGFIFMNLYFIVKEPILVIQKILVSPFFYFGLSSRTPETFVKFSFSLFSLILSFLGLKMILKKFEYQRRTEVLLIISVVLGYIVLHLISGCHNRYSLPIMPYLFVWGGILCSSD